MRKIPKLQKVTNALWDLYVNEKDSIALAKYYQFKASAFKLPTYKLNKKNKRTEDIYKAAKACGVNLNERKQQSRSDDIYRAMQFAGLSNNLIGETV